MFLRRSLAQREVCQFLFVVFFTLGSNLPASTDRVTGDAVMSKYVESVWFHANLLNQVVAEQILKQENFVCALGVHQSVQLAGESENKSPSCLQAVAYFGVAGITPWAIASAYFVPLLQTPLWGAATLFSAVLLCSTKKANPGFLSDRHYGEIEDIVQKTRSEFGRPSWNRDTFRTFERTVLAEFNYLVKDYDDEVEWRHRLRVSPDIADIRSLLTRYLKLWTLSAHYQIEAHQFDRSTSEFSEGYRRREQAEDLSDQTNGCRIALLRMASPNYW
jgi:hypothetical protein